MTTLVFGLIFIQMNHPLAMGLMLLLQTLMVCLMTGLINKSFWFAYILFLVFLGGMLVLFIYVTSLASNEMFSMSMKTTTTAISVFLILMIMSLFIDKPSMASFYMNHEMEPIFNLSYYLKENTLNLKSLYNYPNNIITTMLMNYLLVTLIAVVKITKMFYGPLRPMN
uniref:NADH-ubiquinone oxidoreductase chain 6 n=1 Tax=Prosthiochaeta sp. CAU WL-2019511 TaxID=2813900 RepID=A0A895KU49_9MUSC|nr:NADH dehydrogenase subunit 6 [Prosthiochaeta sp. CAU WL-2019511]